MSKLILSVKFRDESSSQKLDFHIPNNCPHCGNTMSPRILSTHTDNKRFDTGGTIAVFCQCTVSNCLKYFCLEYRYKYTPGNGYNVYYDPINYNYLPPVKSDLPSNADEISPSFTLIYQQALNAENLGLDEISGVGFRKSLEFLIKDYAISKFPDKKQNIEKDNLGKVIAENLSDFPKIQKLAKAANWIGTDATHFVQKYDGSDLKSMKQFIKSSAQFIAADYDADNAQKFIDSNS